LAEVLSGVARELSQAGSVDQTLQAITDSSVGTVPGADYAGIMLVSRKRRIESVARTDLLMVEADKAQEETGEGPRLSVIWKQATFKIDDMETETRWPRFSKRALGLGVRSMLSFQLFVDEDSLGALNLLSKSPAAFGAESEHIGLLFASHAAIALRSAQQARQLAETLSTRDLIGQAKGILMERHHIDGHDAFQMLIRASQNANVKLAEVARYISQSRS
jgi:transcriptional regulator with GAF, ATPase, and Fis domain